MIVIDACGVGALPDAAAYGDSGTNTLGHLASLSGRLQLLTLQEFGLGTILPLEGVEPAERPVVHARLAPTAPGKEPVTGHSELIGVRVERELPTYRTASSTRLAVDRGRSRGPANLPAPSLEASALSPGRSLRARFCSGSPPARSGSPIDTKCDAPAG